MAKIKDPILLTDHFGFDSKLLEAVGVLNPSLNADTLLFIDPLLLRHSVHKEMNANAVASYEEHFSMIIKILSRSKEVGDVLWKSAYKKLSFPEIKGTCLGYGGTSVSGSGSGDEMTSVVISTAQEIIRFGIEDPDLFIAMALFEDDFGPDRISDMTTNVIFKDLLSFNERVLKDLPIPCEEMTITLKNGTSYTTCLPVNPYVSGKQKTPIILVPTDILRDLPIANDWSDVSKVAAHNGALRQRLNEQVAEMWSTKTHKDKDEIRRWAMSSKDADPRHSSISTKAGNYLSSFKLSQSYSRKPACS